MFKNKFYAYNKHLTQFKKKMGSITCWAQFNAMEQKGMTFDHDFYVVGKQCRTENAYAAHKHNIFI